MSLNSLQVNHKLAQCYSMWAMPWLMRDLSSTGWLAPHKSMRIFDYWYFTIFPTFNRQKGWQSINSIQISKCMSLILNQTVNKISVKVVKFAVFNLNCPLIQDLLNYKHSVYECRREISLFQLSSFISLSDWHHSCNYTKRVVS